MGNLIQYSINIAMEATMIFVLAIMLVSLFWEKKLFSTTKPLIFITSSIICMLIVHIISWSFLINDVPLIYGAMPMRIVYVLDFVFSYSASIAFYYYVEALAVEGYKQIGFTYKTKNIVKKIIIAWGIVTTIFYMVMLFVPSIYRVEEGVAIFNFPAYIFLHLIAKFSCICALILLIRHRKVIGKHEVILSAIFLAMITVLLIVEELMELCVGSVLLSIFTYILYVRIDLYNALRLERQEKDLTELKTQIMLSQMQPHFLYNVLTTISSLCEMQNATQARDVVNRFADYFRTNLDSLGEEKTIPFEKELEHIKTYLWLEKVRFEDHLNIGYEIGPTDFEVPSLAVQPIVENAVKHGILQKEDAGTLTIKTYEEDTEYVIEVKDDGVGFDLDELQNDSRAHVGIENVTKRLEIICKGSCDIKSEPGVGTVVSIHIPKGEKL